MLCKGSYTSEFDEFAIQSKICYTEVKNIEANERAYQC